MPDESGPNRAEHPRPPVAGGWFRPVGIDLSPRPPVRTPPLIPPAAQPAIGRAARFVIALALLGALAVAVLLALALHPIATLAWMVGCAVVGLLIRIAWRASR